MSLCAPVTSGFSSSELDAVYSGPLAVSPNPPPTSRDANNMLTSDALAGIISNLKSRGIIPAPPPTNVANIDESAKQFRDKLNALADSMKAEYCFYYSRYAYVIQQWISAIADHSAGGTAPTTDYGSKAVALNRRLMDLTTIISAITKNQYTTASQMDGQINSLNVSLNEQFGKLKKQAEILQREAPEAEIKKRMVEFTKEKAKANNNLLSLYFFLDVVALGILFYVYRAT